VTGAERTLLLALFRWARAEGAVISRSITGLTFYSSADMQSSVLLARGAPSIKIRRGGENRLVRVVDVAEAVDVLAALGIVPARFSTAYRAGWDAGYEDSEQVVTPDAYRAVVPAAASELAVRR
jgi:hypothetical protein